MRRRHLHVDGLSLFRCLLATASFRNGCFSAISLRLTRASAALLGCILLGVSASAQGLQSLANVTDEMLEGFGSWDAMCEVVDCDLIPMRHDTYVIGPNVYYFPDWRLMAERTGSGATASPTGYVERSSEDPSLYLRSFGRRDSFPITTCCYSLFDYYGLTETIPGDVPFSGRMMVPRHDEPYHYNLPSRRLGRYLGGEFADLMTAEEAVLAFPHSYNDDFAIVRAEDELRGLSRTRSVTLLSKRPLLHGRHVLVSCAVECNFTTMAFAGGDIATMDHIGDIGDTGPHIHWYWGTLGFGNMFLCTMKEVENGCDPSIEEFDIVIPLLAALEDMFEAAQVFPERE